MVVTKVHQIKSVTSLKRAVNYILDEAKTVQRLANSSYDFPLVSFGDGLGYQLISGHLIGDPRQATEEFILTKKLADSRFGRVEQSDLKRKDKVLAHHIIQSFSPEDKLTPEEMHEIGRQTILELTGQEHEFVMATHVDKDHVHNHIIFNTTSSQDLKKFRWQKSTARSLFNISNKHADLAGAKILAERSPQFDHKSYMAYQKKHVHKREIKHRLDFLLKYATDLSDFKEKAKALELSVDFSGKYVTYRLLDYPQERPTRDRILSKKGKYSLEGISQRLYQNQVTYSLDEVKEVYQKEAKQRENDFELRLSIKSWQVKEETQTGLYVGIDYGLRNQGTVKIPYRQVEKADDGTVTLFIKKSDFFYFINPDKSENNRFMTGNTLIKQLAYNNGEIILPRNFHLSKLDQLIKDYEFLSYHEVTDSKQFHALDKNFMEQLQEVDETLERIDDKIIYLNKLVAALKEYHEFGETSETALAILERYHVPRTTLPEQLEKDVISATIEKKSLEDKLSTITKEYQKYKAISQKAKEKEEKKSLFLDREK